MIRDLHVGRLHHVSQKRNVVPALSVASVHVKDVRLNGVAIIVQRLSMFLSRDSDVLAYLF